MTLRGTTVLITRQREQSADLVRAVEERGGRAIVVPMIRVVCPEEWNACDRAIDTLETYDAAVFTSPNAVFWFFRRLEERNAPRSALNQQTVYAVGPSTRAALERKGIDVAGIPGDASGQALVEMLKDQAVAGKRFLFPRGDLVRREVLRGLEAAGATVDAPVVYRNVPPDPSDARTLAELTENRSYGAVVFASPSAVRNFSATVPPEGLRRSHPTVKSVAAGRTTADMMRRIGYPIDGIAPAAGTASLILVLEQVVKGP